MPFCTPLALQGVPGYLQLLGCAPCVEWPWEDVPEGPVGESVHPPPRLLPLLELAYSRGGPDPERTAVHVSSQVTVRAGGNTPGRARGGPGFACEFTARQWSGARVVVTRPRATLQSAVPCVFHASHYPHSPF